MSVVVSIDHQTGKVRIVFPDRALGGPRETVEATLLDLLELRAGIDQAIGTLG